MGKYGDIDGSGVVTSTDVNALFDMLVGNVALPDTESGDFFKLNMQKKWAFAGPSFVDLLKMNQQVGDPGAQEDFWDADYDGAWDNDESGKGSYVDMDSTKFVASFPTLMDFASWSGPAPIPGQNEDFRETGWGRLYSKSGTYQTESGLVPPTELYKTKTFEKSDFGLRSLAFDGDYVAISAYMYGGGPAAPNVGSVFVYQKGPSGSYVFRHEIEVSGTTRAPIVEIHGDWLFVGNPIAHKMDIYSLTELDSNQQFYAPNSISPKQTVYAAATPGELPVDETVSTDVFVKYVLSVRDSMTCNETKTLTWITSTSNDPNWRVGEWVTNTTDPSTYGEFCKVSEKSGVSHHTAMVDIEWDSSYDTNTTAGAQGGCSYTTNLDDVPLDYAELYMLMPNNHGNYSASTDPQGYVYISSAYGNYDPARYSIRYRSSDFHTWGQDPTVCANWGVGFDIDNLGDCWPSDDLTNGHLEFGHGKYWIPTDGSFSMRDGCAHWDNLPAFKFDLSEVYSPIVTPECDQTNPGTDWYGSHLHCSDGEQLFVGVENGRLEIPETLTEPAYTVDCGYVDVYNLVDGEWVYLTRITPPDLSIFQTDTTYGADPSDISFGSVVHHRKNSVSGDEYVAIGAPRASTDSSQRGASWQWNSTRYEGSVYIFKKVPNDPNVIFQFVHKENYQDSWFASDPLDSGEFEFGRSVVLDEDLSLWVASNPPSGSQVTRIPKNELVADTWKTELATHTSISSDRIGGTLATNGTDVVFGGPNKLRVFQSTTVDNPVILPKPDAPQETISFKPDHIEEPKAPEPKAPEPKAPEPNSPDKTTTWPDYVETPKVPEEPQPESDNQLEIKLNKPLPREWGAPPTYETKNMVTLPFGYGTGSSTLAEWIEDNSTGDARTSSYLRKLVDADKSTDAPDYYELWEHGNPSIRVRISSDIGGAVNVTTPHGTILVKKNRILKYKSATRSTLTLKTVGDLSGMKVYWSVNGKRMTGNTRLELLVCGEDMDVEVNFSKDNFAENDTPTMCAMTRSGVTKLFDKNTLY